MNKPLVLVVEDDTPVRNLIVTTLKTHEYRYLTAENAADAVLLASSHNPDVVFLDLGLSDADGIDVSNTSDAYVLPWLEALKRIRPESVMIYTVDRKTPISSIGKASHEELDGIAEQVRAAGLTCTVAY